MQLHLTDDDFGANVLLVCALRACYSYDDRVKLDGIDGWHSSGWKWFNEVEAYRQSCIGSPTLYGLQLYCVCLFTLRFSVPILT